MAFLVFCCCSCCCAALNQRYSSCFTHGYFARNKKLAFNKQHIHAMSTAKTSSPTINYVKQSIKSPQQSLYRSRRYRILVETLPNPLLQRTMPGAVQCCQRHLCILYCMLQCRLLTNNNDTTFRTCKRSVQ